MYNKVTDKVNELGLEYGHSYRGECPKCNKHNTFTVTFNDEGLVYNCYSLSCDTKGKIDTFLPTDTIVKLINERKQSSNYSYMSRGFVMPGGHDFEVPDRVVPVKMNPDKRETPHLWSRTNQFLTYWGITPTHNMFYDIKDDRIVFPVYGSGIYSDVILDMVGRSLDKEVNPKWLRYGSTDQPYVSSRFIRNTCVIVEDVISAVKVQEACGLDGVALLGTQLTQQHKDFIAYNYDSCIIALDRDALNKQMSMARELSSVLKTVKVCRLQDDIKYGLQDDVDEINRLEKLIHKDLKEMY